MNNANRRDLGVALLRYTIVGVFLYFGLSQLFSPADWVDFLPEIATTLPIAPQTLILMNGSFEVLFALALLAGAWTRVASALLGVHLLIIGINLGWTSVGVRDLGLAVATISLVLLGPDAWTIDSLRARRVIH